MLSTRKANPYLSGPFRPVSDELEFIDLKVKGEIPKQIHGYFMRNSPNPRFSPRDRYHWFDGDAMIHSMELNNGKANYRNRYVRTTDFKKETQEGSTQWNGILDSFDPANPYPDKDTANTDLVYHNGKLLALWWLSGNPYEIGIKDLRTIGQHNFQNTFTQKMAAHSKVDPVTNEMMFINFNPYKEPYFGYGVISAEGKLVNYTNITIPGPRMFHDIGISANHTILLDMPLIWHTGRLAEGKRTSYFDPNLPGRFGIIPRHGKDKDVIWFETNPCYIFHTINAWEEGDEIVLIACRIENPIPSRHIDPLNKVPRLQFLQLIPYLTKWRFNLKTKKTSEEKLDDIETEFPKMNDLFLGRKSRYSYNPRLAKENELYFDAIVQYDLEKGTSETFEYGKEKFGGEVIFIPDKNSKDEKDGWISTFVYDREKDTTDFAILDTRNIKSGPVAEIPIPRRVPIGFHACWVGI